MKKAIAAIFTIIFCLTFSITAFGADKLPQKVLDARDGVVRIHTTSTAGIGTGSGFAVGKFGDTKYVITNNHVIENYTEIMVYFGKTGSCKATVIQADPSIDLAILKLETPQSQIKALPIAYAEIGNNVFTLGFPGIADDGADSTGKQADKDYMTIGSGIVASIKNANASGSNAPIKSIQTDASMHHGNSGGPLVNTNGHVVGVNSFGFSNEDYEVVNFAISSDVLIKFLDDNRIPFEKNGKAYDLPLYAILLITVFSLVILALIVVIIVLLLKSKRKQPPLAATGTVNINEPFDSVHISPTPTEIPVPTAFAPAYQSEPSVVIAPQAVSPAPVYQSEPSAYTAPVPRRKSTKAKIIGICSISLVALIILGFGILNVVQISLINTAIESNDYIYATELYKGLPYLQSFNKTQYTYCNAMVALEQSNMSKAKEHFSEIKNYKDSAAFLKKIDKYNSTINTKCTFGEQFIAKYNALNELGSFANCSYLAQELLMEYYVWAEDNYSKGLIKGVNALEVFASLGNYGDAPLYTEFLTSLLNAKSTSEEKDLFADYYLIDKNNKITMPYFNDDYYMCTLLRGSEWYSKNDQYHFYWPDGDGYYDINLPGSTGFGTAFLQDTGIFVDGQNVCHLSIIDFATIELQVIGYQRVTLTRKIL